jgi:single-stranded DNA-specific DHH superfamily exonuclease
MGMNNAEHAIQQSIAQNETVTIAHDADSAGNDWRRGL